MPSTKLDPIAPWDIQRARQKLAMRRIGGDHPPPRKYSFYVGSRYITAEGGVYLIDLLGGRVVKRAILELDTYHAVFGPNPTASPATNGEFDQVPDGEALASGSFLGIIYGVGSGWLIDGGVARGVTSADAWNGYGFSWDNKQWISQELIDAMPKGEFIGSDNLTRHLDVSVK